MTEPTTYDITAVRNRLQWALHHATRIDASINAWADGALAVDVSTDPETGRFLHRIRVVKEPPVDVALALSDALHQTRAALDNLVGVLRGGPTDRSAYVITDTADKFDNQASDRLQGVPAWAVTEIRRHQPFVDHGWKYVGDGLLQLHDLARLDRHRAPLVQGGIVDIDKVYVGSAEGSNTTFVGRDGGAEILIGTSDPNADPHFGATVLVREESVRLDLWPYYPSALDLAMLMVGHAQRVLGAIYAASGGQVIYR